MSETYEIRECPSVRYGTTYTVLAYQGDTCLGGDAHWLTHDLAVLAMRAYESGRLTHGKATESDHLLFRSPQCTDHRAVQH